MVMSSSASKVLLLLFLSVLLSSSVVSARRIDCTRFVFAPRCRGVAAKRAESPLSADDTTDLDDPFSESMLTAEVTRDEDSDKFMRLLTELSRALRHPVHTSTRGKELLDRLLRS